jgi:hypothetical protein
MLLTLSTVVSVIAASASSAGAGPDSLMGGGVFARARVVRASQIRDVAYTRLTLDVNGA